MYEIAAAQIAFLALALAGCSAPKASERAEREYEMMERGGASLDEKCAKRREIAGETYLKEGDEQRYLVANIEVRNICNRPIL